MAFWHGVIIVVIFVAGIWIIRTIRLRNKVKNNRLKLPGKVGAGSDRLLVSMSIQYFYMKNQMSALSVSKTTTTMLVMITIIIIFIQGNM